MNNEQTFDEFLKYYAHVISAPSELRPRALYDWFATHHRQALEKVEGKIEKLPSYYGNPKHNEMIYRADALAIIREEI